MATVYLPKLNPKVGGGLGGLPEPSSSGGGGGGGARGEVLYTKPGTHTFVCPEGVTSVCAVCVGGGAGANVSSVISDMSRGGPGGALAYVNDISLSPGDEVTVTVGRGGVANSRYQGTITNMNGLNSSFGSHCEAGGATAGFRSGTNAEGIAGQVITGTGGAGGAGPTHNGEFSCGSGAGGYSGAGGKGASTNGTADGLAGSGGGGGGGGVIQSDDDLSRATGGGGVDVYGEGDSGAAGKGKGGSGAADANIDAEGSSIYNIQDGQPYGGGGSGKYRSSGLPERAGSNGAHGAVRVIWGSGRAFPSTDVGREATKVD